jgi:pyrimidine deaminase RibD-like protein
MRLAQEDQKHMEAAVEQAKLDQRIHRVGARIVKGGELLAEAHGLEEGGQHAEFTAIKICEEQGKDLNGATLYTTFEPCIHVRSQRKADCAVRVVESGITEVVIGMLDPDERVCSRGCSYLQQNGVHVRHFPTPLREKIEDLNIDFIEARALGVDPREVQHSLTFTKSGKRRPILGFADALVPDLPDIKSLVELYSKRPIMPHILWPPANDALWRNALKQRQRILENIRIGASTQRSTELVKRDSEWISAIIRFAWKIRTLAAARIPKMWQGMAPLWKNDLRFSFEESLASFLIVCNTNVLLTLTRAEQITNEAIFPPARKWVEMVMAKNGTLSDVYQEVFDLPRPFYQVTVSRLGNWRPDPDKEIYVPKSVVVDVWRTAEKRRVDWISSKYMVPQVEYELIGARTIVEYGPWIWRRTLNDRGMEIPAIIF